MYIVSMCLLKLKCFIGLPGEHGPRGEPGKDGSDGRDGQKGDKGHPGEKTPIKSLIIQKLNQKHIRIECKLKQL